MPRVCHRCCALATGFLFLSLFFGIFPVSNILLFQVVSSSSNGSMVAAATATADATANPTISPTANPTISPTTNPNANANSNLSNYYAGDYTLVAICGDNCIPVPLPSGGPFVLKLSPVDSATNVLRLNTKVDNTMGSSIEFLVDDVDVDENTEPSSSSSSRNNNKTAIRIGPVMSSRMMARSKERRDLESYLGTYLERMVSIELRTGGAGEGLLILSASGTTTEAADGSKAKIVCRVVEETQELR